MISPCGGESACCEGLPMKTLLQTVGLVAAVFILAVIVDQFTPLKQLSAYLAADSDRAGWPAAGCLWHVRLLRRDRSTTCQANLRRSASLCHGADRVGLLEGVIASIEG